MDDGLLARINRQAGVADLVEVLAQRLEPADLGSLLLAVHRRRSAAVSPAGLLEAYERNRFVSPGLVDAAEMAAFDVAWFDVLKGLGFEALELSPVGPFATVAAVTNVNQNNVLTAARNTEVVSDSTNVLALESAVRRRAHLRENPRSHDVVRLCASHRLVRGQFFSRPGVLPHFRLMALTTAGRDLGSFRFEVEALNEQLEAHLLLLRRAGAVGVDVRDLALTITDLSGGVRRHALQDSVMAPLHARFPAVAISFDDSREAGRAYYRDVCFFIHAANDRGERLLLSDGGFTDWTAQLMSNRKERLLISGMGTERLVSQFSKR